MSQSSSSAFQALFDAALQDYEGKTGISLIDHPFVAREHQECDSVGSIIAILEEQAQNFHEFRAHGKLVDSLKNIIDVLSSPFISTGFDQGTDLVVRPIFVGIAILLAVYLSSSDLSVCLPNIRVSQALKDVSASYDALVDLFEFLEKSLSKIRICTEIPLTEAFKKVLVEILVELLSTLALATQQVKQGQFSESVLSVTDVTRH